MTRCCRTLAIALGVALLVGAPARAADPSAGPLPGPSAGPSPVVAKLGRRSLAPTPDYAMPRAGGTVNPTRIARDGWQHCALTFDDGPNEITPRILDILKRERVIATYFPIAATAARHPDAVRAFVAAGYEIGNHSLAHRNLAKLSAAAQRADLAEANRILTGLGARPTLFRPPYAAYDAQLIESARGVGLETVLWSLDVRDWEYHDAGMLAARVDAGAGPALVVLMHATYSWTERALPEIIHALRDRGCRFVTLSAWLAFMRGGAPAPVTPTPARVIEAAAEPPPAAASQIAEAAAPPPLVAASAPVEAPTARADSAAAPPPAAPVVVAAREVPQPIPVAAVTPAPIQSALPEAASPEPTEPAPTAATVPVPPPLFRAAPEPAPPPVPPRAPVVATLAAPPPAQAAPVVPVVAAPRLPHPPARQPAAAHAAPPAAPRPVPIALTLRPATLSHANGKTELRIVGDDAFLTLGPGADLDAITAQIKDALDHPRR